MCAVCSVLLPGLTASQRHEFIHPYTSVYNLHTSVLHPHTSTHHPHTSTHLYTHLHTIPTLLHTSAHHPHISTHSARPVNNVIQRAMVVVHGEVFFKFFLFVSISSHIMFLLAPKSPFQDRKYLQQLTSWWLIHCK